MIQFVKNINPIYMKHNRNTRKRRKQRGGFDWTFGLFKKDESTTVGSSATGSTTSVGSSASGSSTSGSSTTVGSSTSNVMRPNKVASVETALRPNIGGSRKRKLKRHKTRRRR